MEQLSNTVDEVITLYKKYGHYDYIGEPVTQTEHMVLAAMMAEEEGCDDQCILAAFLHDIGHLLGHRYSLPQMDSWGTTDHDLVGYHYLTRLGFPEKVCTLVKNHVLAKRYLVTCNSDYYNNLSEASKTTLTYQGGLMTPIEVEQFEKDPYREEYIKFRKWEEKAKESRYITNSLHVYKKLCYKVLSNYWKLED